VLGRYEIPHPTELSDHLTKHDASRLGSEVNLEQLDSFVEDKAMLAENLENLVNPAYS